MAISSYSCHKGGKRDSYITDDCLKVNVIGRSLCDKKAVNKDFFCDQIYFNNILTDETEFTIRNKVAPKKSARLMRRRGWGRKMSWGRSLKCFRADKGLRSKRKNSEVVFEESDYDSEDWIFDMCYEYTEDYPPYEYMTYNQYLAQLKKAS